MIHRRTHPRLDQPDCFGCKVSGIRFGTVPGGTRSQVVTLASQREKDLHRYRDKRQAGEQPDGTSKKAMDAFDRRMASWEKAESKLRDDAPPETFKKLKKSTFNGRV